MSEIKKVIAAVLCLVLVFGVVPITSMANPTNDTYEFSSEYIEPSIPENDALNFLKYAINGKEVIITGYKNNPVNLVIPTKIEGIPVTKIMGNYFDGTFPGAFEGCSSLESITIPNSVTSIGYSEFSNCISLFEIIVDENNENYCSVDGVLFDKNKTILVCYPAGKTYTTFTIPESVTSIAYGAFSNCSSLSDITIPDSVANIGSSVFDNTAYYNNESNWENGVLYIGNHLIKAKEDISGGYEVKNGTKTIADNAFYECSSLQSITIPDSVTSIGSHAFKGCTSLQSITIPNSVTSIGYSAFYGCNALESITIPDSVTSIGGFAFAGCSSLQSITIPDSVTSIVDSAFSNCKSLQNIVIPDSVTSIGMYAFFNCSSLQSITIPDSVKYIEWHAFDHCSSLKSIIIPDSVTSIGEEAFSGCSSLQSITIPDSVKYIEWHAFDHCSSLKSIIIPDSVTRIEGGAFANCSKLTDVYFENDGAFTIEGTSVFPRTATFHGYIGSTAETFAKANGYNFVAIDNDEPTTLPDEPTTAPEENEPTIKNSIIAMFNAIKAFFTALTNFFNRLFSFGR